MDARAPSSPRLGLETVVQVTLHPATLRFGRLYGHRARSGEPDDLRGLPARSQQRPSQRRVDRGGGQQELHPIGFGLVAGQDR